MMRPVRITRPVRLIVNPPSGKSDHGGFFGTSLVSQSSPVTGTGFEPGDCGRPRPFISKQYAPQEADVEAELYSCTVRNRSAAIFAQKTNCSRLQQMNRFQTEAVCNRLFSRRMSSAGKAGSPQRDSLSQSGVLWQYQISSGSSGPAVTVSH